MKDKIIYKIDGDVSKSIFDKNAKIEVLSLDDAYTFKILNALRDMDQLIPEESLKKVLKNNGIYNETVNDPYLLTTVGKKNYNTLVMRVEQLVEFLFYENGYLGKTPALENYQHAVIYFDDKNYINVPISSLDEVIKQIRQEYKKDSKKFKGMVIKHELKTGNMEILTKFKQDYPREENQINYVFAVDNNKFVFLNKNTHKVSDVLTSKIVPTLHNGYFILKDIAGYRFYRDQDGFTSEYFKDVVPFRKTSDGELKTFVKDNASTLISQRWYEIDSLYHGLDKNGKFSNAPEYYRYIEGNNEFMLIQKNKDSKPSYIILLNGNDSRTSNIGENGTDLDMAIQYDRITILDSEGLLKFEQDITDKDTGIVTTKNSYIDYIGRHLDEKNKLSGIYLYKYKKHLPLDKKHADPVELKDIPAEYFINDNVLNTDGKDISKDAHARFVTELCGIFVDRQMKNYRKTLPYEEYSEEKVNAEVEKSINEFKKIISGKIKNASKNERLAKQRQDALEGILKQIQGKYTDLKNNPYSAPKKLAPKDQNKLSAPQTPETPKAPETAKVPETPKAPETQVETKETENLVAQNTKNRKSKNEDTKTNNAEQSAAEQNAETQNPVEQKTDKKETKKSKKPTSTKANKTKAEHFSEETKKAFEEDGLKYENGKFVVVDKEKFDKAVETYNIKTIGDIQKRYYIGFVQANLFKEDILKDGHSPLD